MSKREMNNTDRSIFIFSIYEFITGTSFLLYPKPIAILAGVPTEPYSVLAGWHVVGLLILIKGMIDFQAARTGEMKWFYPISIYSRFLIFIVLSIMAILGFFNYIGVLFGSADLICAIWTLLCIKKDKEVKNKVKE